MKHVFLLFRQGLLALLLAGFTVQAHAQAPAWQTAVAASQADGSSFVLCTAADASGNVYVAGYFTGAVSFGSITLTSVGAEDAFVAKWSAATASFVWAQRAGGPGFDFATAVAASGTSVYATGYFNGATSSFGTITLTNADASNGNADVFVAKLTDAGSGASFAWAQRAGGTGFEFSNAIAASGTNVYVVGAFNGATTSFGNTTLTNSDAGNGNDVFVAKLTDAGNTATFGWAQRGGGPGFDIATGVGANGTNVYVAGYFDGAASGFGSTVLSSAGSNDVFVTKLTDAGNTASFAWTQQAGGPNPDEVNAVAVAGTNVYLAGNFAGAANFGNATLNSVGNSGAPDVFVAKLTDAGGSANFSWAQRAGGVAADEARALAVRGTSVYVTGAFRPLSTPAGTFNTADFGSTTLTTAGDADVFLTKLTDAGNTASFAWARSAGGTFSDVTRALAVSGTNVYVAGNFSSLTATFGSQSIVNPRGGPNLVGSRLAFLASLIDPTLGPLANRTSALLAGVTVYPNPAHAAATVLVPAVAGADQTVLTLFDATGRVVCTQHLYLPKNGIAAKVLLSKIAPGLYRLRIEAGDQHITRALAVQ